MRRAGRSGSGPPRAPCPCPRSSFSPRAMSEQEPRDGAGREDQYAGTGFFDDLTWLPSRLLFRDRAERAIAWADRHGTRMAVLFIEVDDFEEVSRRLGSEAADSILRDLGNRLVAAL